LDTYLKNLLFCEFLIFPRGRTLEKITSSHTTCYCLFLCFSPGTIRDNIARGKPTPATEEEIVEAAKAACAHEFISELADGYDTFYSGASLQISGGQAQRIAIARAIIRNPKILVLDEATSALDTQSERVVQDALAGIRQSRKLTTISVAHRLSTIINCDQIAVIADGCIQELGSHKKLFEEGGIYTQLCEAQGLTADCTEETTAGVEAQGGGKEGVANATTATTPTKDEQPNVDPDDVDVELGATSDGDKKGTGEEAEMASPSRLWQYNRPEVWYMAVGAVGALIVGALPPVEGILFGIITANFFGVEDVELMRSENRTFSLYFLILAGASFFGNLALGSFAVSGSRLTRRMRVQVFEKIMRQSLGWFDFPAHSTGELTTRLEEDSEAVANVTGYQLGQRIQIAASLVAGITISLSFSWQIGLIALACVPLIVGSGMLQARCTRPRTIVGDDGLSAPTILERGVSFYYFGPCATACHGP
jgi:ATP-binding cassette, subfamily B (MDR/TAP), member 1